MEQMRIENVREFAHSNVGYYKHQKQQSFRAGVRESCSLHVQGDLLHVVAERSEAFNPGRTTEMGVVLYGYIYIYKA